MNGKINIDDLSKMRLIPYQWCSESVRINALFVNFSHLSTPVGKDQRSF